MSKQQKKIIQTITLISFNTIFFFSPFSTTFAQSPAPSSGTTNIITSADSCGVVTKVGNPQGPAPTLNCGTVTCDKPAPSGYANIKSALSSQFKIDLQGDQIESWAKQTYDTACVLSKASQFYTRLMSQGNISVTLHGGSCSSGHASAATGIDLYGDCSSIPGTGLAYNRYILTHELGHMFAFRNPSIYNQDFMNNIWGKFPSLPTWDCQIHFGDGSTPPECFAAMVGEYAIYFQLREVVSGLPAGEQPFKSYPTTYSGYYNFARDHIYGGIEYKSF